MKITDACNWEVHLKIAHIYKQIIVIWLEVFSNLLDLSGDFYMARRAHTN